MAKTNTLKNLSGVFYLRIALGLMFLVHGFYKLVGLTSGAAQPMGMFQGFFGASIGPLVAWLVALIEFLGGAFLILGFLSWTSSFLLAAIMAGSIVLVHLGNWSAITQHLVFIAGLVAVMKSSNRECSLDEKFKLKF
ncbi:MAG: DoxX family protein [Candidatus Woesearchaeota archaeon]